MSSCSPENAPYELVSRTVASPSGIFIHLHDTHVSMQYRIDLVRYPIASIAILALLSSCAGMPQREHQVFERTAEISTAIERFGQPMSPREVLAVRSAVTGRTILVDGYLSEICEAVGRYGCVRSDTSRFTIFGERERPSAYAAAQPCSAVGNAELLLLDRLPSTFSYPAGRRVLIQGKLIEHTEKLPAIDSSGGHMQVYEEFNLVLADVVVLALYESYCRFPK